MQTRVNEKVRQYVADSALWLWTRRSAVVGAEWLRNAPWTSITDTAHHIKAFDQGVALARRKLEIAGSPSDSYFPWMTDTDGNLHPIGDGYHHPYAAADWCERNGFAWEVVGATGDPLAELAAWRAAQ